MCYVFCRIPIEHRPPLEACTARGALFPPQLDESGKTVQATVLITPALSAIASLVRSPSSQQASSGDVPPPPPPTPGPSTSHDGPVGGEGEEDTELQQVYNPSFDVTPADLIAAIVTEKGVLVKEGNKEVYDLRGSSVV
jgi:methylthioribose-1-phosphate isomerase